MTVKFSRSHRLDPSDVEGWSTAGTQSWRLIESASSRLRVWVKTGTHQQDWTRLSEEVEWNGSEWDRLTKEGTGWRSANSVSASETSAARESNLKKHKWGFHLHSKNTKECLNILSTPMPFRENEHWLQTWCRLIWKMLCSTASC